jgi:hypothetical protein
VVLFGLNPHLRPLGARRLRRPQGRPLGGSRRPVVLYPRSPVAGPATCTLPVGTCPVPYRTYVRNLVVTYYCNLTSLSARTWARPAARRRLCDLPKVRRAREEVTSHSIKKHCSHRLLTFSSFDFHDRALRGRAVLGRSRGRRRRRRLAVAPRAGLPLHVRRIPNRARGGGIRSDNLSSVVISSCSGTRSLTRRRTRRTGTHSALDRCPPLPAPACPCPLCALRRRSHRA